MTTAHKQCQLIVLDKTSTTGRKKNRFWHVLHSQEARPGAGVSGESCSLFLAEAQSEKRM